MRTLLVHCGSFKTGSSRIQDHAWRHRREMAALGWLYPQTGVVRTEPEVGYRHSALAYGLHERTRWNALVDALIDEIEQSGCENVLLSSEAWSSLASLPSLAALLQKLRRDAGITEVRGVVYVRNRVDYLRSHYREFTRRRGNTQPFGEYVAERLPFLDPPAVLIRLRALFGSALAVVPYAGHADIGAHFFGSLALPYGTAERAQRWNAGLDAVETEARRILNVLAPSRLPGFPGLGAVAARAGIRIDPAAWTEAIPDALSGASASIRETFVAGSGWGATETDRFFDLPVIGLADVADLAPSITAICEGWLAEPCFAARYVVESVSGARALDAAIDRLPNGAGDSRISGYAVLPAEEASRFRVLARIGEEFLPLRQGLDSPRLAARFPGNPAAKRARFTVPLAGLVEDSPPVEILLEDELANRERLFRIHPRPPLTA